MHAIQYSSLTWTSTYIISFFLWKLKLPSRLHHETQILTTLVSNTCCYIVSSHKERNLIVILFTYAVLNDFIRSLSRSTLLITCAMAHIYLESTEFLKETCCEIFFSISIISTLQFLMHQQNKLGNQLNQFVGNFPQLSSQFCWESKIISSFL